MACSSCLDINYPGINLTEENTNNSTNKANAPPSFNPVKSNKPICLLN